MKNKYCDVTIRVCKRENTCYMCDDPECRKCGDIEADCGRYHCINKVFNINDCYTCKYNANTFEKEE